MFHNFLDKRVYIQSVVNPKTGKEYLIHIESYMANSQVGKGDRYHREAEGHRLCGVRRQPGRGPRLQLASEMYRAGAGAWRPGREAPQHRRRTDNATNRKGPASRSRLAGLSRHGPFLSEVIEMAETSKLMAPLFHGSSFNRDGRRMRAVFVKSVSDGTDEYRLWRGAGKPDNHYANAENDKYYLYVEINGYLAPMGLTEFTLVGRCGIEAVDERHGGSAARRSYLDGLQKTGGMEAYVAALDEERTEIERLGGDPARQAAYIRKDLDGHVRTYLESKENGGKSFPDFVGALVLDDLARCAELSVAYRAMRQEERQASAARAAEEEKAFCEEQNRIAEQAVSDAVRIIREGGELKNDTVTFYRSKYEASSCSVVLYLMRRYGIDVPLRTQGWISCSDAPPQHRGGTP